MDEFEKFYANYVEALEKREKGSSKGLKEGIVKEALRDFYNKEYPNDPKGYVREIGMHIYHDDDADLLK